MPADQALFERLGLEAMPVAGAAPEAPETVHADIVEPAIAVADGAVA